MVWSNSHYQGIEFGCTWTGLLSGWILGVQSGQHLCADFAQHGLDLYKKYVLGFTVITEKF